MYVCKLLGVVGMFDPCIIPSIIFRLTNFQEIVSNTRNVCSISRIFFHILFYTESKYFYIVKFLSF